MTPYLLSFPHLCLFLDELDGMVFRTDTRELIQLDPVSVWLLLALDDGKKPEHLPGLLSKQCSLTDQHATQLISNVMLLVEPSESAHSYAAGRYPELDNSAVDTESHRDRIDISVARVQFAISTPHQVLYDELVSLLCPVENSTHTVDISIFIKQVDTNFQIIVNNLLVQEVQEFAEIMPELIDRIQVLAYQFNPYYFCFHGAGVKTKERILLMPGVSGAGKSTLSALLCANDGALFSDEMLVFDTHFNLIPISLPIAVKSGSWKALNAHYPELAQRTVWHRLDGRQLKYVWPKRFAQQQTAMNNCTIINPRFVSTEAGYHDVACDKQNGHEPMSLIETMQVMTSSGYQVGVELNQSLVESWFHFLQSTKKYRLRYDETDSVTALIEGL